VLLCVDAMSTDEDESSDPISTMMTL
jgi:hypothetical protein